MSKNEEGIYQDPTFQYLDIGAIMRVGHPDIEDGDRHIVGVVGRLRAGLGRPLRILDVGSGSGHLSFLLAQAFPDCQIIANDVAPAPIKQALAKLQPFANAQIFDGSFDDWTETVDVVVSWGSHHHLSHDYLDHIRSILSPDGVLIIGDEMCPEYLTPDDQRRLAQARRISIIDGYIFDNDEDLNTYRQNGVAPEWSLRLEEARRRSLWTWYKFVGDYAMEKGEWTVLITELQIARDDLITAFGGEHKTSPYLLERELILGRFTVDERLAIGDRPPELQSFVIYTCRPDGELACHGETSRA